MTGSPDDDRPAPPRPRVLAVVVAHDGAEWLPRTLDALGSQGYDDIEVVGIDNASTDGSRAILVERLGEDAVLVAERDLGFGAAVAMALDARSPVADELVLFVHDDLVLGPDAVGTLVDALRRDPRLAVVGPKLVDWDDPRRLQSVGFTIDSTGRAESGLEEDELDQGQRDHTQRSLYVSTAGMLVRRDVFERLGRFDRRYHLFRDDLDLCWRAWLAGHDVEVVPEASAGHVGGAANYRRLGQTQYIGPRYFAERNTLATLIKNYGTGRLLLVLPLFLVVGVAKVLGFVATRRLSDAWLTVRAWVWNVVHLRATLRLRRSVQGSRMRSDAELRELFGRLGPRVRAYTEAIGDWIAGGDLDLEPTPTDVEAEPRTATERVVAFARRRPFLSAALVLGTVGLVTVLPLLGPGSLRGGDLAPWPAGAGAFLRDHLASWHDAGGLGTSNAPSPAQALLGLLQVVTLGSEWLASRLLVVGALPLAWILALRAGVTVSPRRLPRLVAATAYVLSPPALAAVRTARIGSLVLLVALPGLAAAYAVLLRERVGPARAWRATAAAALLGAVAIAFEPTVTVAALGWLVVALATVASTDPDRGRRTIRLLVAGLAPFALLLPWSIELFRPDSPVLGGIAPVGADAEPFWRWLLLSPGLAGFPGVLAGAGVVLAGVLGLLFGFGRRPVAVAGLWTVALAGVFAAWALGRAGEAAWTWPGVPLLVTAGAFASLLAIGFAAAGGLLTGHSFGWRQVASLGTAAAVALAFAAAVTSLLGSPWEAYSRTAPLPAFLASDVEDVGAYRILVLADRDGVVDWDIASETGPTMAAFGVTPPDRAIAAVDGAVTDVLEATDPGAAGRLAALNVRYVVVPPGGTSDVLSSRLDDQLDLEPQPVAAGRVYRVSTWLSRATWLEAGIADSFADRGEVPDAGRPVPLAAAAPDTYAGEVPGPGAVFVSEHADGGWRATLDGRAVPVTAQDGLVRVDVPEAGRVVVEHDRDLARGLALTVQSILVLLTVSLMLRPPGFARERR